MISSQQPPEQDLILIVDDIASNRQLLTDVLTRQGYRLQTAADGAAALGQVAQEPPDLILLDINMPGLNGYQVCQQLKANPQMESVPVIFVSALDEVLDKVKAFEVGGVDYITRPFELAEVLARIKNQLTRRHLQKALQQANETLEERVAERTAALTRAVAALEDQIVERQQAEAALQEHAERLRVLHRIDQAILAAQSPEAITQAALQHIQSLVPCQVAALTLFDAKTDQSMVRVLNVSGDTHIRAGDRLPLRLFGDVAELLQGHPHTIPDLSALKTLSDTGQRLLAEGIRAVLNVPLIDRDSLIGVLNLGATTAHAFNPEHAAIVREVGIQLTIALQNARLHSDVHRRNREMAALYKAGRAITSSLELAPILEQVMAEVKTMLAAETASVLLLDPSGQELIFAASARPSSDQLIGARFPAHLGLSGWALTHQQPVIANDAQTDGRFYKRIDALTGKQTKSLLAVPLIFQGVAIGVVEVLNKTDRPFDQADLELLEALTSSAAIAIKNAQLYEDIQDQIATLQGTQAQLIHSEKMSALGRLAASLAHEINNPLQSVQTCLTLTKEELAGDRRPDKLERYLDIVEGEIDRISTIVHRMRNFYRPAQTGVGPTALPPLLENVLALTAKQLQHSNISLETDWPESLPQIEANADHLKQVLLNFVLNAIDAMPHGGKLRLALASAGIDRDNGAGPLPAICLTVADSGHGMSSETQAHIFEPFFTTKAGGSGLGLSISYSLIEAHHGQVEVISGPEQGTTFTILLPVTQPETAAG